MKMIYPNCSELVARLECNIHDRDEIARELFKVEGDLLHVGIFLKDINNVTAFYPIDTSRIKLLNVKDEDYNEDKLVANHYSVLYFGGADKAFDWDKWKKEMGDEEAYEYNEVFWMLTETPTDKLKFEEKDYISRYIRLRDGFGAEGLIAMIGDYDEKDFPLICYLENSGAEVYPHDGGHKDAYDEWCLKEHDTGREENDVIQ